MTAKENFYAFFCGKEYEWRPCNTDIIKFGPEELGDYVARGFVFQQQTFDTAKNGGKGWFGINWIYDPVLRGSIDTGRIIDDISEWKNIPFTPLDSYNWDDIAERNKDYLNTDKVIQMTVYSGFFERLISVMDFSDALLALIDEDSKPYVHEFFNALTEYYIDYIKRCRKYFGVDFIELHDDWGSQKAPLFSADTYNEMIAPYIKRVVKACHSEGIIYMQHSCGHIEEMFGAVEATGADTWLGQDNCNNKPALIDAYPDFHFGVIIKPEAQESEEASVKAVLDIAKIYDGKKVWFFVDVRNLKPEFQTSAKNAIDKYVKIY